MTLRTHHTRALIAWLLGRQPDPPAYIDLTDPSRKQAVADAEYQARADAESKILRRSWVHCAYRRVPAVVERVKVRQVPPCA